MSELGKILTPDDLEVGMFVTVLKGRVHEKYVGGNMMTGEIGTAIKSEDRSFHGHVLRITAICLPYVAFKHYSDSIFKDGLDLDVRLWTLMKLPDEYVKNRVKEETRIKCDDEIKSVQNEIDDFRERAI